MIQPSTRQALWSCPTSSSPSILENEAIPSGNVVSGQDIPKIGGPGGVRGHRGGYRGREQGANPPPPPPSAVSFLLKTIYKLQHSIVYTTYSFTKHTKLCSEVQNFIEKEHFAARKQAIAANRWRSLSILGVWPNILCARFAHVFIVPTPSSNPGSAPGAYH